MSPPRTANSPRRVTMSTRVYAASTRRCTKSAISIRMPIRAVTGSNSARPVGMGCRSERTGMMSTRTGTSPGWARRRRVARRRATVSGRGESRSCGRVSQAGKVAIPSGSMKLSSAAASSSVSRPVAVTTTRGRSLSFARPARTGIRAPPAMVTWRSPPSRAAAESPAISGSRRRTSSSGERCTNVLISEGNLGGAVEALLGGGEPAAHQISDRVSRGHERYLPIRPLRSLEIAQHERRGVHPPRRAAHPYPQAQVVLRAEGSGGRLQAVVAPLAAAAFEPQRVRGQVEFVVDEEDLLRWDRIKLREAGDHRPGDVHVGLRFREDHSWAGQTAVKTKTPVAHLCTGLVGGEGRAHFLGHNVEHHLPDVVSVPCVGGPGGAEAHHEE